MRYLGGKTRNASWIVEEIGQRRSCRDYVEPFCGGLSVAVRVKDGPMFLSDVHPGLINLYRGLHDGTFIIPEKTCTREEYNELRKSYDKTDPYHTMVGFGLSYSGKWWGGYDSYYDNRGEEGKTWGMLVRSLTKKMQAIPGGTEFNCIDYTELDPVDSIIYCDPPYGDSTEYDFVGKFDHALFWDIMRRWSERNVVLISEYAAPRDFILIKEVDYKVQMCVEQKNRIERLFIHEGNGKF